jgi:hypothetical protein
MIEVFHLRHDLTREQRLSVTICFDEDDVGEARHDAAVTALWLAGGYEKVATVDTDDLEVAWALTNNVHTSWSMEPDAKVTVTALLPVINGQTYGRKSSEVGDVFVLNGVRHVVASIGFRKLPEIVGPVSDADLDRWTQTLQDRQQAAWAADRHVGSAPEITWEAGPRYARIVRRQGSSTSAYGFIERSTGLIFKAEGWKRPAKHARGNLHGVDPYRGCGPYGMNYLR